MLFNSFVASALVLALTSSVNAQASTPNSPKTQSGTVFFPPGSASPGTSGIQTISASAPCGGNMSLPIDPSSFSPITVGSNKQFTIQAENFGSGGRSIQTAQLDPAATGESFDGGDCTIISNGLTSPSTPGTQNLILQLPDNIKCAGGPDKNLCLLSLKTDANNGNCLVVKQGETTTPSSTGGTDGGKPADTEKGGQAKTNDSTAKNPTNGMSGSQTPGTSQSKTNKRMIRKRMV